MRINRKEKQSRSRTVGFMAFLVVVTVLVKHCNGAAIGSVVEEVTHNDDKLHSGLNDTLHDYYYSGEDEYDYNEDGGSTNSSVPVTENLKTSPATTIKSTTAFTTTTELSPETNFLDDTPLTAPVCPLDCHCTVQSVNCSGRQLKEIPKEISRNVEVLDMSYNLLTEVDLSSLVHLQELRELNLSHNHISNIKKLDAEMTKLVSLDFEDNRLEGVIDPDTFKGLTQLKRLTLSNNSIGAPESREMFNLHSLEELYLRNCSVEELSPELFKNFASLKVLDLSENPPFTTIVDTNTFEPLSSIKRLRLSLLDEEQILEMCRMLVTIDVIHFPDFQISCFEYVSGYTFEESIVQNTPAPEIEDPYVPPVVEPESSVEVHNELIGDENAQKKKEASRMDVDTLMDTTTTSSTTTSTTTQIPVRDSSLGEEDEERRTGEVDHDLMNQILLVIILLAFLGLVVGLICRRDYCGIKTKCCRTRRPSQTDQVTPAPEEVPLNKLSAIATNGRNGETLVSSGNGATAALKAGNSSNSNSES